MLVSPDRARQLCAQEDSESYLHPAGSTLSGSPKHVWSMQCNYKLLTKKLSIAGKKSIKFVSQEVFDSHIISFKHFQLKDQLILWSAFNRTNLLHLYLAYCLLGTWAFCTLLVSWANRCGREVRSVNAICISTWDTTWITVDPEPPHELRLHHLVHGNVWRHANTLQNHIRIELSSAFQMHSFGAASLDVVYYNLHQAICCSKEIHIANAKACSLSYRSRCTRSITTDRMHVPWIKVAWDSKESSQILNKNKTESIIDIYVWAKKKGCRKVPHHAIQQRCKACIPLVEDSSNELQLSQDRPHMLPHMPSKTNRQGSYRDEIGRATKKTKPRWNSFLGAAATNVCRNDTCLHQVMK